MAEIALRKAIIRMGLTGQSNQTPTINRARGEGSMEKDLIQQH